MKLKDSKNCHCKQVSRDQTLRKQCRFGYCTLLVCWKCTMTWAEFGPVDCPHKKNENGTLRWYKYPDMDVKPHVAVKKNKLKRRHAYPKRSWREKFED